MTQDEYRDEIRGIAEELLKEWRSETRPLRRQRIQSQDPNEWVSDRLHQWIDGHSWIIYTSRVFDVLRFTNNREAYQDEMDELPGGDNFDQLATQVAFVAMRQDVMDVVDMDDYEIEED